MTAFLYLLPCAGEDLIKLGISRDPLARARSLAPRWFEFFDLDHAWLLQADDVAEAQAWETALKRSLRPHNAPAPLLSVRAAGGFSEWFRGAHAAVLGYMDTMAGQGFPLHPARPWLGQALARGSDSLYGWADALWQSMLDAGIDPSLHPLAPSLRDACDEQIAFALELEDRMPAAVARWYRELRG
ncbi:GIY-YIG nuclease family protein [Pseudoxanthomonas beigongshangi]